MKKILKLLIFQIQKILLNLSYYITKPFCYGKKDISWVVVGIEIASYVHNIADIIDSSVSVAVEEDPFFKLKYTYVLSGSRFFSLFKRLLYGPILFGILLNRADGFLYVTSAGFLLQEVDGRLYEFKFIKKKNKKIICIFLGNDIRSPKKMLEYATEHDIDVAATYYYLTAKYRLSLEYEKYKEKLANASELCADLIYNAPIDQKSYFNKPTLPIFYIYPDKKFIKNDVKYSNINLIKIVHAPSSPITKGTQLVRAAIKKLKVEGYCFEYVELINVSNDKVMTALKSTHIVLNEFYALVPGIFGIEAMANHCALLTSADCRIETSLPKDSYDVWKTTRYWEVYDNIKLMLDNPYLIKEYADRGFEWTKRNCSYSVIREKLNKDISGIF